MLEGVIIGGGISGLAVAHFLGLHQKPGSWELWEASDRLGGTIGTDRAEGYSIDWGPNGFLDREPLTLQLLNEIGLSGSLEPANEKAENRFIVKHGRMHPVPLSPLKMMTTGLLSPLGKARVFAEPFIPRRRDDGDESVFDFAARPAAPPLRHSSILWFRASLADWPGSFRSPPASRSCVRWSFATAGL
jgi:oxygen-dependent protoporphyrinogen oxidase